MQKDMNWHRNNLMAPWTSGFRRFLAKRLVTCSRSAALSENASTFVKHLTVLLLIKRCPEILIFLPSAPGSKINHVHALIV
jgi:hypothetical protein